MLGLAFFVLPSLARMDAVADFKIRHQLAQLCGRPAPDARHGGGEHACRRFSECHHVPYVLQDRVYTNCIAFAHRSEQALAIATALHGGWFSIIPTLVFNGILRIEISCMVPHAFLQFSAKRGQRPIALELNSFFVGMSCHTYQGNSSTRWESAPRPPFWASFIGSMRQFCGC